MITSSFIAGTAGESVFLDWASTAVPRRDILEGSLNDAIAAYGNPSSAHREGAKAARLLEKSRQTVLSCLGVSNKGRLAFTGSGTEADHIPLLALLRRHLLRSKTSGNSVLHFVVSAIEHSAIHSQCELLSKMGIEISWAKPDALGFVHPDTIVRLLRPETRMVALMYVNNETGAVQDIQGLSRALDDYARKTGRVRPALHVDGVQALGKIEFNLNEIGADSAAFSAHKIGGPRGIGALWTRDTLEPLAVGGGQEEGLRPGTENLFGALGFARALEATIFEFDHTVRTARALEKSLLEGIKSIAEALPVPATRLPGDPAYSPWIASLAFPGVGGETMVRALSDAGIMVSTGSACSQHRGAKAQKERRVLAAMGIPAELSFSAIRVSWGWETKPRDMDVFLETAAGLYRRLKT